MSWRTEGESIFLRNAARCDYHFPVTSLCKAHLWGTVVIIASPLQLSGAPLISSDACRNISSFASRSRPETAVRVAACWHADMNKCRSGPGTEKTWLSFCWSSLSGLKAVCSSLSFWQAVILLQHKKKTSAGHHLFYSSSFSILCLD